MVPDEEAMTALSTETPLWESFRIKAREAREIGATSRALAFFEQTLAEEPPAADPYAETADFIVQIERALAPLEGLYERHRAAFNLSPSDISFRTPNFPINGEGLRQSVGWLEMAVDRDPADPTYQERLAEVLEELGHVEAALDCRRKIAQHFPAVESNQAAIAILLERNGAASEALDYCEGLLDSYATIEPATALCLARLYEHAGRHAEAELLGERLSGVLADAGPEASAMLFGFAWSAANHGLPTAAEWPHALLRQVIEIGQSPDAAIETQLAAGFAACVVGNENSGRKHFAAACWKAHEQFGALAPPDASRALRDALDYAARMVLNLAPSLGENTRPPVATRHLLLACAHDLRKGSSVAENLARFEAAFAAMFDLPKDDPFKLPESNVYRGYRVVARDGQYYAIPLGLTDFTIVRGTVYRLPGKTRIAMELCPPRFRRSLRRVLARYRTWRFGAGAPDPADSPSPRTGSAFTRLFALFQMPNVLKTADVLALYGEIDAALRTRSTSRNGNGGQ